MRGHRATTSSTRLPVLNPSGSSWHSFPQFSTSAFRRKSPSTVWPPCLLTWPTMRPKLRGSGSEGCAVLYGAAQRTPVSTGVRVRLRRTGPRWRSGGSHGLRSGPFLRTRLGPTAFATGGSRRDDSAVDDHSHPSSNATHLDGVSPPERCLPPLTGAATRTQVIHKTLKEQHSYLVPGEPGTYSASATRSAADHHVSFIRYAADLLFFCIFSVFRCLGGQRGSRDRICGLEH